MSNKIESAKEAVNKMLFYYNQALVASGCPDVKREMATQIPKMINLSSEQTKYVLDEVDVLSITDMLKSAVLIIGGMEVPSALSVYNDLDVVTKTINLVISKLEPKE